MSWLFGGSSKKKEDEKQKEDELKAKEAESKKKEEERIKQAEKQKEEQIKREQQALEAQIQEEAKNRAQDDQELVSNSGEDPNLKERFDFDEMMNLVDNDIEMAVMMLSNFLESENDTLNKIIAESTKNEDKIEWQTLRKDSHSLKGSSSYLCAKQVSFLSYEIQKAAEAHSKEQIDMLVPLLVQEFEIAVQYMENKLRQLS